MTFSYPYAFLLFLPAAIAFWRIFRRKRGGGILFASASTTVLQSRTGSWRYVASRILPWFFAVGICSLVIAAAGPRTSLSREVKNADALAVIMAVDVSGSMRALDLMMVGEKEKTRLDVVKETFKEFVSKRTDDLIGLVTFGGYASTRSPLTADHRALLHTLSGVQIPDERGLDEKGRPISEDEFMTAIGDGLATSLARLQKAEPKTKIVILLSDGENNAGITMPLEAAEAAKTLGIKVYTIGVGSTGVANVRVRDTFGNSRLVPINVSLEETTLKKIAEITGGIYYNVKTPKALDSALESIGKLETTRIERQIYYRYSEHFAAFLLVGVFLVLVSISGAMIVIRRPL